MMSHRDEIVSHIEEHYPFDLDEILLADGFEEAFTGVVESFGSKPRACYDYDKCIEIIMDDCNSDDIPDYDEAVEHLEFNVTQAWVGEYTPAFIKQFKFQL